MDPDKVKDTNYYDTSKSVRSFYYFKAINIIPTMQAGGVGSMMQ